MNEDALKDVGPDGLMVYSYWLGPGPGPRPAPGPVLCRTFHITPGPGQGPGPGPGPGECCLHVLNKAPFSPCGDVIVLNEKT